MIFLDPPPMRQQKYLEEYDTPFTAYLRAKAEDVLNNSYAATFAQGYDVTRDRQSQAPFEVDQEGRPLDAIATEMERRYASPPAPRVDRAAALERAKEAGVSLNVPDDGMSERVLDALIERKRRQKVVEDSINRSPTGFRSVAGLGVTLGVSLLDPFNLAAAFVPVVGEARYAAMLAGASGALGRAQVRAGVGAIEGAVGIGALEAPYYSTRRALQDDYTMMDSLVNIGFGTVLGGGLHVVGGAVVDLARARGYLRPTKMLEYTPSDKLTPEQRLIELRFGERLQNLQQAEIDYAALKDSQGGKVLNTDVARELDPAYLADRTQSAAVHEPASAFVKKLYINRLKEEPKPGEEATVMFTAGGTGAGKTRAIDALLSEQKAKSQIVYDTNMNKLPSAVEKIEMALAAKKNVFIAYVYREPGEALTAGALPRAMQQENAFGSGRTVPIEEHLGTHTGASEVIRQLREKYKGDARVTIVGVDNSRGRDNAAITGLDSLPKVEYTQELHDRLSQLLAGERAAGRISDSVYRGFAGRVDAGAPRAPSEVGARDRSSLGSGTEQGGPGGGAGPPAGAGRGPVSAAEAVASVSPQVREAAIRAGTAQSVEGNVPDVESLVRSDPASGLELPPGKTPLQDITDTARRQLSPDQLRVGSHPASTAADERLKNAPETQDIKAAEADLKKAMEALQQRFAAKGAPTGALKRQFEAVEKTTKEWGELATAARAASVCDLGKS